MKTYLPMDRRPSVRRSRLARLGAALVLTIALAITAGVQRSTPAGAATPPELKARVSERCDKVILSWRFEDEGRQRDRTLEIQRATGSAFTTVLTRATPSRRGTIADPLCPTQTMRYRARLTIAEADSARAAITTPWGPEVTVEPDGTTSTSRPTTTTTAPPPTTTPTTTKPPSGVTMCPESYDDTVIANVNAFRKQHGLAPVKSNAQLNNAANRRAADLAALGRLDNHAGMPKAVQDAGYRNWWVGEWLHWYISVGSVVNGWIGSTPHRDALLWTFYSEVGIGCASGPHGGPFWSMIAGAPL